MSVKFDDISVGEELPPADVTVTRADLIRYAGASGDFNVIHWNERVATSVGLPGVIAHGMYTMALGGQYVSEWAGDAGAVVEYGTRFTNLVPVPDDEAGATITYSGKITKTDEAARTVTLTLTALHGGQKVLGKAIAVVRLP
ncbi:MaoC family dehydratase [Kineosporia mesophila]|uniref:MaoC family dehydratase n=1 Tax=Kineosporia mesophila TaxID=566012 RepID=A0ABP6ZRZ8_9ACTN|nr:MaoC/PaaZ C-terminal domain-containing protein [Kineosporia mesophila]MCD5350027.1 MaoC family dehydratase N-terminal domain-containing protein [Kineosporia mesophila]